MSVRATSWVLGHSPTKNSLRLVLAVLAFGADSASGSGRMRPKTLAAQATIPLEQVETALKALAQAGEIEFKWSRNRFGDLPRTFAYRVQFPDDYHPELRA